MSRLIDRLAADPIRALKAIRTARATARVRSWALAGTHAPGADGELIAIDIDATIVIAHSDKQPAAPTWKKTFGFHPMTVFADHGPAGGGEPLALLLRPGNAGSTTAADHITATRLALAQLPRHRRRQVLIRTDSGGGTHEFLSWLSRPGRTPSGSPSPRRSRWQSWPCPRTRGRPPTTPRARYGRVRGSPSSPAW